MFFLGTEVRTIENNAKNVYAAEIRFQKSGAEVTFRNQMTNKYIREEKRLIIQDRPKVILHFQLHLYFL